VGLFEALRPEARESILSLRQNYLQRRNQKLEALQANMDLGRFGGEIVAYMGKQIKMEQEWIRRLRRIAKTNIENEV
jgi:hypothetical protein